MHPQHHCCADGCQAWKFYGGPWWHLGWQVRHWSSMGVAATVQKCSLWANRSIRAACACCPRPGRQCPECLTRFPGCDGSPPTNRWTRYRSRADALAAVSRANPWRPSHEPVRAVGGVVIWTVQCKEPLSFRAHLLWTVKPYTASFRRRRLPDRTPSPHSSFRPCRCSWRCRPMCAPASLCGAAAEQHGSPRRTAGKPAGTQESKGEQRPATKERIL